MAKGDASLKIAIAGKGGTGKTYIAASLARMFIHNTGRAEHADQNYLKHIKPAGQAHDGNIKSVGQVYALDADPCGGLGAALGLSQADIDGVRPIVDMREFIEQGEDDGDLYLSAPDTDIVDGRYSMPADGVNFLRLAYVKKAGAGCYCHEFGFLQALLKSMLLAENDVLILDMPAGIEHLTRGAIKGVDILLRVSEATRACVETTKTIRTLGADLGIPHIYVAANKIRNEKEELLIRANFRRGELIGLIRMSDAVSNLATGVGTGRAPPPRKPGADIDELFMNLQSIS
jgi:CO dehydrogenase maturation factor